MSAAIDPIHFEDAVKSEKWRGPIDVEMEAIEKNHTRELTDLPKGAKKVGVRWVYKTKFNENGEVETIRLLVAFAAQRGWIIYQLDVKSAFLHGELTENIFVEQPCTYVQDGNEHKVYKLKKALCGLKQEPRAWYSRMEAYFMKVCFEKCDYGAYSIHQKKTRQ